MGSLSYLLYGLGLVVLLAWAILHYYARSRKAEVEEAKYRMLDDEEG